MVLDAIETVVCDIDGVVVLGGNPIPGAGKALARLRAAGLQVVFITNNSTKTRDAVAARLAESVGYVTAPETILSSGWATGHFIAGTVERVFVLGSDGLRDTLRETGVTVTENWQEADGVVVGLDFHLSYRKLAETALAVQNGAALYATNTDASYPTPEGLHPGAGSLVALIETTVGVNAQPCGKPFEPMRRLLADFVDGVPIMIGDRPDTDIALGKAEGWATALVLTGVTRSAADVAPEYLPDLVLDSIADLPGALGI